MREIITLECSKCKNRNYNSTRNKKKQKAKVELSKFCNTCREHTIHKETK